MKAKRRKNPAPRTERGIVQGLIRYMKTAGFELHSANDGEENHKVKNEKEALDVVFSVDESWLRFQKPGFKTHTVALVGGNGEDIISDFSFSENDVDGFEAAMDTYMRNTNPKKRRKKNPAGKARKYYCVDQEQKGLWYQVAHFFSKNRAAQYANALAKQSGRKVRVKHTFPGASVKPQ